MPDPTPSVSPGPDVSNLLDRRVASDDEVPHERAQGSMPNESWYFDWVSADGDLGGYLRIGYQGDVIWYWAALAGRHQPTVMVVDHEIPVKKWGELEIRGDGLWADHRCEEPGRRWVCHLESFGLSTEDPSDFYAAVPRGDRVPFGFELEWTTDRFGYMWPPVTPRYEVPCTVQGEVSVGDRTIAVEGAFGQRDHSWGAERDWWAHTWCWNAGRLTDGTRWYSTADFRDLGDFGLGYVMEGGSSEMTELTQIRVSSVLGDHGFASTVDVDAGSIQLSATPYAWAPVRIDSPDGRTTLLPRGLAKVQDTRGREGFGWFEWSQPPDR